MRDVSFVTTARGLALASMIGLCVAACGDDDGSKPVDGGKSDSAMATPDGGMADGPAAGQPDMGGMDAGAVDTMAPQMDGGAMDAAMPDGASKDASITDAPMSDTSVDGGKSAMVARGAYLVDHLIACSDCHTPKLQSGAPDMSRYLAGNPDFVKLPNGDALPSRNLTPDKATGLGNYTADQIKHMFMDGVVPGGADGGTTALNPVMPYYVFHNMTSDDADAVVAYLQSIPPISHLIPPRSAAFDVPAPADYVDPTTIPMPADSYPQKASAMRGRYLAAESGLCIECHTEHNTSGSTVISPSKFFQGGEDFSSLFAGTLNIHPVSANLTSDPTTGLGTWTTDQIVNVILSGKDKEGTGICPPMPAGPTGAYGGITTQDAVDIANFIKSLPPVVHDVPDMCSFPPTSPSLDGGSADVMSMDSSSG
jgi:cytochrome c553